MEWDNITAAQMLAAAGIGTLSALWGWFGWLVVIWAALMAVDYISGSLAAVRAGKWSSDMARDGLSHKGGMIFVVLIAGAADLVIGLLVNHAGIVFPFTYSVLISPLCLGWYILTECGSILENAHEMGAPVPGFMLRMIRTAKDALEREAESAYGGEWTETEKHFPLSEERRENGGETQSPAEHDELR